MQNIYITANTAKKKTTTSRQGTYTFSRKKQAPGGKLKKKIYIFWICSIKIYHVDFVSALECKFKYQETKC